MDAATLQPDFYARGDNGNINQVDASANDVPIYGKLGGVVYRTVAAGTAHTAFVEAVDWRAVTACGACVAKNGNDVTEDETLGKDEAA